jgi:uncharacterized protein HemX
VATAPAVAPGIEPESAEPATTDPATTDPATTDPATKHANATTETSASTEPSPDSTATPGTSEPVVISTGVDEAASPGSGTIAFFVTMAIVFALGGFVVYRARQARARAAADADVR